MTLSISAVSDSSTVYGNNSSHYLRCGDGQQARGRQTTTHFYGTAGYTNIWAIGEYMSLVKQETGTWDNSAAYYIPAVSVGTENWAIYCHNAIAIKSSSGGIELGSSLESKIYHNGTSLVVEFDSNSALEMQKFDATYTSVEIPDHSEFRVRAEDTLTVYHPFSKYFSSTQSGTLKINLGRPMNEGVMGHYVIDGFNYTHADDNEGPWQLTIGFYDTGGLFYARNCSVNGNPPFLSVRLAIENSQPCILLGHDGQTAGEEATAWNYPWISVERITTTNNYGDEDIEDTKGDWSAEFSTDESTDWTLTGEVDVDIFLGPGCTVEDQGDGTVKLLVNSLELSAPETGNTPAVLTSDMTIYVKTTGNDTTGNGTSSLPYATIGRAISDLSRNVTSVDTDGTGNAVIIDVEAGHYSEPYTLLPWYPYGGSVYFYGDYQDCDASTATAYGAVTASGVTGYDYINVSGVLASGTTATVGDYLVVRSATGGTNPQLVEGCHEITAWNSGTRAYTCKVMRRTGITNVPSGTITLTTAHVSKTVVTFTDHGILVNGSFAGGTWEGFTLVGTQSHYGVWCLDGGKCTLEEHFSTSNWSIGAYVTHKSYLYADYTVHSYNSTGFYIINDSSCTFLGGVINGSSSFAIQCLMASAMTAKNAHIQCAGNSYVLVCQSASYLEFDSGTITYPTSTAYYGAAYRGGGIDLTSATLTGGVTAVADANSYIIGP